MQSLVSKLPNELWLKIGDFADYKTYLEMRVACPLFRGFPVAKGVPFPEYCSLLHERGLEVANFEEDYAEPSHGFWHDVESSNRKRLDAFQRRIMINYSASTRFTQKHYLYLCRNKLAFEVCKFIYMVLENSLFARVNLGLANEHPDYSLYFSIGFAIHENDAVLLDMLFQDRSLDLDATYSKNFAFQEACSHGHLEIAQLLLSYEGVIPNDDNNCAICCAAFNGHINIVEFLLKDSRVDPAADGNCAIGLASELGHDDIVKLLISDDRVDPGDDDNYAFRMAACNGHNKVVRILLADDRVDPNAQDNLPIRLACLHGHLDTARLLLSDHRVAACTTFTAAEIDMLVSSYNQQFNPTPEGSGETDLDTLLQRLIII